MWVKRIHAGHILGRGGLLAPVLGVFGPKLIAPQDVLRRGIDAILQGERPAPPDQIPQIYV